MNASPPTGFLRLSQIQPERLDWLWPGRIAAGTLVLLDGDPGQGKSLLTLDLAARLSTGRALPDGHAPPGPCATILFNAEDSLARTVVPRLQAAQADLDRIHVWQGSAELPCFPQDLAQLRAMVDVSNARLVILDPFLAFLSAGASGLNDVLIRLALLPLARLAADTGAAVLLVRHLTKRSHGRSALRQGTGAMALIGAARTAFLVGRHPEEPGRHLLACTKNNLAESAATLAYRIGQEESAPPIVIWEGPVALTADALVPTAPTESGTAISAASAFLIDVLAHGTVSRSAVLRQARAAGITDRTLDRARIALHVTSHQQYEYGHNVWYWTLPETDDSARILRDLCREDEEIRRQERPAENDP